jgi:NAD(P)-dependent dehydrogenase (short-subunit alcohol dehydrogenase family)
VSEAVERIGGSATGFAGSPADPATADALIASCVAEFGGIDILVNCAGTGALGAESILNVTSELFHELLDAHLLTAFETRGAGARSSTPVHSPSSATTAAPGTPRARVGSTG